MIYLRIMSVVSNACRCCVLLVWTVHTGRGRKNGFRNQQTDVTELLNWKLISSFLSQVHRPAYFIFSFSNATTFMLQLNCLLQVVIILIFEILAEYT